jgi:hypothetical protein
LAKFFSAHGIGEFFGFGSFLSSFVTGGNSRRFLDLIFSITSTGNIFLLYCGVPCDGTLKFVSPPAPPPACLFSGGKFRYIQSNKLSLVFFFMASLSKAHRFSNVSVWRRRVWQRHSRTLDAVLGYKTLERLV